VSVCAVDIVEVLDVLEGCVPEIVLDGVVVDGVVVVEEDG
jgi:hypothetical protein